MDSPGGEEKEQPSFQDLKNKWSSQEAILPPKPSNLKEPSKRVSLLTQQFEKAPLIKAIATPPLVTSPPPITTSSSSSSLNYPQQQTCLSEDDMDSSDSDIYEDDDSQQDTSPKLEESRFAKRAPPPPPPPSKKYHRIPTTDYNPHPATIVDTSVIVSPPVLPPRPPAPNAQLNNVMAPPAITSTAHLMPQLPPRPSQSTLARAHTIASKPSSSSPASTYGESPSFSEYEESSLTRSNTTVNNKRAMSRSELLMTSSIYPDFSQATRNAPYLDYNSHLFSTGHKSMHALACSHHMVLTGAKVLCSWSINSGTLINTISDSTANQNEINDKVKAIVIAPTSHPYNEGKYVWTARQDNVLTVVEYKSHNAKILCKRNDVHQASIVFLLRYGNSEIWSIDEQGVLNVWDALDMDYEQPNPLLTAMPRRYNVTSKAVAATIYQSKLWMSSGRTLAVHSIPVAGSFQQLNDKSQPSVRIPNDMGNITKLMTIPYHPDRIFCSHDDGKISIWNSSTMERLQVITVSMYGICTMACVGEYHVWAGYNTGMIYVYDTRPERWHVLKMWKAHTGAVTQLSVDETSLLLDDVHGKLQVVSGDSHGFVGVWDGLLIQHWKDDHLNTRANEYCTYSDKKVMMSSWNIDANKPERITGEDDRAVREWLGSMKDPDLIVVGIQEIVDLESKKQTARSLFARKKVDSTTEAEDVLTHRYKLWHDYLVRIVSENFGLHTYTVIKTDQLVGLFSCVFVRTSQLDRVQHIDSTSVKTGLKVMNKSIHGNKGGIAIRFLYDHSSLCFVNCHLAAGQSHVQQRNADVEGILQSASFPHHDYQDVFVHGGDGSMVMDHEVCFLSGDLNYRIQLSRKEVLDILLQHDKVQAWETLQQQDQLLRQHVNNPLFKLLQFNEAPIHFDPTYKYDPGTDFYDRSEKKRVPAWCDRILFKGRHVSNLYYKRFEPRCSDHRPIGAGFTFQTKLADQKQREELVKKIEVEWKQHVQRFIKDKKARYVADYERCSLTEAFEVLKKSDWDVNEATHRVLGLL